MSVTHRGRWNRDGSMLSGSNHTTRQEDRDQLENPVSPFQGHVPSDFPTSHHAHLLRIPPLSNVVTLVTTLAIHGPLGTHLKHMQTIAEGIQRSTDI